MEKMRCHAQFQVEAHSCHVDAQGRRVGVACVRIRATEAPAAPRPQGILDFHPLTRACERLNPGLGSSTRSAEQALEVISHEMETRAIAEAYLDVLAAIERERLDANVSVKPTALGLDLSYKLSRENLESIIRAGGFVRIDMEDSSMTDRTLRIYRDLRE